LSTSKEHVNSNVKEGFYKRDFNDQTTLSELDQVNGNTQGKKLNNIWPIKF
jgi:hypothetical protein